MNKEVHYEGWLIKSPPTKRIWRARWRRRWFTLKQGEIPEQFCLEYYTDRNCRKLKGVIDLDQCEQVDCGLRLENRKQKFQFMFDIKTPKRTYYLAADTEADMRDWVNCICQVCHLHDTKQSNEMQDTNHAQNSNNTTTTASENHSMASTGGGCGALSASRQTSFNSDMLRRPLGAAASAGTSVGVVDRQPHSYSQNNSDCAYVNTEYSNRETLLCDMDFDLQQQYAAAAASISTTTSPTIAAMATIPLQQMPSSPVGNGTASAAIYLNSPIFGAQQTQNESAAARSAVNSNGVVRKIPENLVLNNTPLPETIQQSVQPSPALSTASGPYIPISECFSGSPKFVVDSNNPATPLNNLDPKFYDTPRSHNNIGLNLTNDQSYSPKITNCSLQQISTTKNRNHRSDSDSESVFTDDDEWTHPLPLRENVDRSTRPSDSSVENESFVLTYSQRFSKLPDDAGGKDQKGGVLTVVDPQSKLAKVLKNKNNLVLDFKENEKITRDIPQLSDTENTSPAIGPRDATSVVEESYDIPRSHNLPYYNMGQFFEKISASPEANPIAASTPNLIIGQEAGNGERSLSSVRTLPRPHCYTNAAPNKVEGNVFRYDFMEQADLPPVNRNLKPKVNVEDKPPEELPAKPPSAAATIQQNSPCVIENLSNKLQIYMNTNVQSPGACTGECSPSPLKPPSVDRKLKPNAYKFGTPTASMTLGTRRSTGAPLCKVLPNDGENYIMETRTLPRQPRPNFSAAGVATQQYAGVAGHSDVAAGATGRTTGTQHQRTASAAAAMPTTTHQSLLQPPAKNEHKLQYFDLDVANPPPINRQSMSVGNLNATGNSRLALGLSADPSARAPVKSSVVYNSVDFVKTEAFKRIREERKKESEGANNGGGGCGSTK